jgi:hypothetical protein
MLRLLMVPQTCVGSFEEISLISALQLSSLTLCCHIKLVEEEALWDSRISGRWWGHIAHSYLRSEASTFSSIYTCKVKEEFIAWFLSRLRFASFLLHCCKVWFYLIFPCFYFDCIVLPVSRIGAPKYRQLLLLWTQKA